MNQKPKTPSGAKDILKEIDKIISELDKKTKAVKMPMFATQGQMTAQGGQGQDSSQSDGSQGGSGQSDGKQAESQKQSQGSGQGKTQGKEQQPGMKYQAETMSLLKIHESWNSLEPEAAKAGMSSTSRDDFEQELDKLTASISEQKLEESLISAIELYKKFSDLIQIFSMSIPPDYFQVKYEAMAAMAFAAQQDWEQASAHITNIQDPWNRLKVQSQKASQDILMKTDFAVTDLENAVNSKQLSLVIIKGDILMKNLKALEQKLSGQQGGGQ
ncbi:hypothetical protein [Syntrophomonas palmitatica]|uniref:hypothetical protein n=1 Tax=Syntrophomonas palmitatica TaxID=402877 RepID=UPI0012ECF2E6|nr:hypothetical protein [Syntrophomonas palmitatica]